MSSHLAGGAWRIPRIHRTPEGPERIPGKQPLRHRCLHKVLQWNPLSQALGNESPAEQLKFFSPGDTRYATQHFHFLSKETSPLTVTLPMTESLSNTPCHSEDYSCSSQTAPPKQLAPAIKPTLSMIQASTHPHLPPQLPQRTYEELMQKCRMSGRL